MEQSKMLPNNKMAEIELISNCIQDEDIFCEVLDYVKAGDFYDARNSLIFEAITNLFQNGVNVSAVTVSKELGANMEQIKITYLATLFQHTIPNKKNAIECAKIVKECAERRKTIKTATEMLKKSYDMKISLKKILGEFETNTDFDNETKSIFNMQETMEATIDKVQLNYNNGGKVTGMETGLTTLDRALNGFNKGDMIIISARPSMGKTVFSLNIAERISRTKSVYYCSLEMDKARLGNRMLAMKTKINSLQLSTGNIQDNDWVNIGKASSVLSNNKLFIDECSSLTVLDIKSRAKKIQKRHGLDMIIVDHLGLVTPTKNYESTNKALDDISWKLKQLAKDLNCCVVVLSQLSRTPEQRADHRPILSDLRESGGIEQNADIVISLYRDEYYNKGSEDKGIMESIILKARDGEIGTVKLAYIGEYQLIGELDTIHC